MPACTNPLIEAINPYVPIPRSKDLPVEPTKANAVIVVPKTLIKSKNGPML